MELYPRWLAKYESEDAEGQPLGIILCAGASTRQIELLERDAAGIHVAEYLTNPAPAINYKIRGRNNGALGLATNSSSTSPV